MKLDVRPLASTPVLLIVGMLVSAVLGAGVSAAVMQAPTKTAAPAAVVVTHTAAKTVAQPRTPRAVVQAKSAPVDQSFKATFVSSTSDSVTVQGVGTVHGTPDVVTVSLQVSVVRDTAGQALDAANAVVSKVFSSLRQHGVAAKDIQSTGLSLNATYAYHENSAPTLTGYQAGQSMNAKLRSASKRGVTISAVTAVSEGDVAINGLSFDLEQNAALLTKAQRAAFAAAKKKAAEYADLAGRSLGRVLTINEVPLPTSPEPFAFAAPLASGAGAAPSDVPIAAGSQAVGVSVTVTWALR